MDQRPPNDDYSRVNSTRKNIRRSIFHPLNGNANAILHPPPQPQVYIVDKDDFKSFVQQLTGNHHHHQPCERLPQNIPKRQKIVPEPINQTSSVPTNATPVQDDPHVSLYMRYLQNLIEDSSSESSNGNQFQQPFDECESQPQVPMPYSNGLEPVMTTTTTTSPWFDDGSPQQMNGYDYSFQSKRVEYPQPSTPNFTFSSMNQHGVFDSDLERF
ncbi:unnamed protein product [Microthlaspi erraticum]|uniref:VQ domain-containing protein n=1 Tax=Microthlaspi erraticum TaxID=1685480 RepID=A0A6D2L1S0_9BRAS|nr:unnamed protein product [Microthlaspi erraticum]